MYQGIKNVRLNLRVELFKTTWTHRKQTKIKQNITKTETNKQTDTYIFHSHKLTLLNCSGLIGTNV